jgi:hypothetical protein
MQRNRIYRDEEKESLERFQHACEGNGQRVSVGLETVPVTFAGGKP